MTEVLNIMFQIFLIVVILVGIVALAAGARFLWITAKFTYVFKLLKYDEEKLAQDREYNVISATNKQLILANQSMDKSYSEKLVDKAKAEKIEAEAIANAQKLKDEIKSLEEKKKTLEAETNQKDEDAGKRGAGRPRTKK